jgi:DNA repair exonuclease SbcCD ATPase subunit
MYVKDFLSLGEENIPLAKQGLVLIEGENRDDASTESNGAGKSSIFEALIWCLYGITLKYGADQDAVVRNGCKSCRVVVGLTDDAGQIWSITRTRPAKLELYLGSRMQTTGSIKETQLAVDALVGMDADTFMNTVFFGQGRIVQFSALTDKEQKAVLERLIGVEAITEAHKNSKLGAALVSNALEDAEEKYSRLVHDGADLATEHGLLEAKAKGWAADRDKRLKQAMAATGPVVKLSVLKTDLADAEKARDLAEKMLADAEEQAAQAAREQSKVAVAQGLAISIEAQATKALNRSLRLGATCNECQQEVDGEHKMKIQAEAKKECTRATKALTVAEDALQEAVTKVAAANREVRSARDVLASAHRTYATAKANMSKWEAENKAETQARKRVQEIEDEENAYEEQVARVSKKLASLLTAQKEADKEARQLRVEDAHWRFVVEALSNKGLKSFVLDSVIPFLNQKASEYAGVLSGGNLSVEFQTQSQLKSGEWREKFAVVAHNEHGADVYAGNSGGEKRKIDMAVALALQALAATRAKHQIGLALYDEPAEALDATATEHLLDLLVEEAHKRETVLVITHNESAKSQFPTVWKVIKEDGISRLA